MSTRQENERNAAAYHRMKETIEGAHPRGWFVAIADDRIVAAAADFRELEGMLRAQGNDPRSMLVVEAGVDYPEYVTIFDEEIARTRQNAKLMALLEERARQTETIPLAEVKRQLGLSG